MSLFYVTLTIFRGRGRERGRGEIQMKLDIQNKRGGNNLRIMLNRRVRMLQGERLEVDLV